MKKEEKNFLLVGVAKTNFFYFAIEKKRPPQHNEHKVDFIPIIDNRVDYSKK